MPPHPDRAPIVIRCENTEERDRFHEAAKAEGFNNLAGWILYHLRNQAKKTLAEKAASKPPKGK